VAGPFFGLGAKQDPLICCAATSIDDATPPFDLDSYFQMINVFLALVPLVFATGALVWTMTSGARAQARSDAWAAQWMRDNA
jgi:hypothetical protein